MRNIVFVCHLKVAECGERFEKRRNERPPYGRPRFTLETKYLWKRNIVKRRHQALHKLKKQRGAKKPVKIGNKRCEVDS